jgi:thiamine phosphate synthase YjbQ (UPF0047 family)
VKQVVTRRLTTGCSGRANARHFCGTLDALEPKRADRGIDGRLYFHDQAEGGKIKQVIFSVKAGNLTVGHQAILPITAGRLDLGPWQQVHYAEFDGQRPKRLILKALGE